VWRWRTPPDTDNRSTRTSVSATCRWAPARVWTPRVSPRSCGRSEPRTTHSCYWSNRTRRRCRPGQVRTADPGRVRRQPSRRGRPPGSVLRCPSRVRRIQFPGDIPGLPPARSSDRGERARSGGHRPRVDPYGPQRHEGTSGHGLARRTPQGWLRGRRGLDGVASRNGTRGRLRRIVSSWRAERAAWRAVLGLPPCTCSSRPVSWPGTPAHPTTPPPTWTRFGVCVAISRARCLGRG